MITFYTLIILIAVIILIIILIILAILMSFKNTSVKYPPLYGVCPDYWLIDSDKKCQVPTTTNAPTEIAKINSTNTPGWVDTNPAKIDFNNDRWNTLYPNKTRQCALNHWTKINRVEWDGISNYNNC